MRILICPDKFKGSLTAPDAARAMAEGARRALPQAELDLCPLADGGEGTVAALVAATGGRIVTQRVVGPLPDMQVDAAYGLLEGGRMAVIEMAAASGLALVPPQRRNPLHTTTFGTGQLLLAAAAAGARSIILGLGGSATTDGGVGAAQGAGLSVRLEAGLATEPLCGRDLDRVTAVHRPVDWPLAGVTITAACDVTNPLFGPQGAAPVYSPQKGADGPTVERLDTSLRRLAERLGLLELAQRPGAGAAGGLGFGMLAFFGASLRPGIELVGQAVDLRRRVQRADLVLTGEGKLDEQSLAGKVPAGVAALCRELGKPCLALAGRVTLSREQLRTAGFTRAAQIGYRPDAMTRAAELLAEVAAGMVGQREGD
jgi:glycerate kinase